MIAAREEGVLCGGGVGVAACRAGADVVVDEVHHAGGRRALATIGSTRCNERGAARISTEPLNRAVEDIHRFFKP